MSEITLSDTFFGDVMVSSSFSNVAIIVVLLGMATRRLYLLRHGNMSS
jgi:hypothetical protein